MSVLWSFVFVMESKTNVFRNSQRFNFLHGIIFEFWENQLLSKKQISKVRQRFYNAKKLRAVRLLEILILKRALAQTVCA